MSANPNPLLRVLPRDTPRALPDYLPARMVNEFVYCPRLFFYEWVDGLFRESADTIEGSVQHRRVDKPSTGLPGPNPATEKIHVRSVTLSSERLRVIAKLDLAEAEGTTVTPVDYKHGAPREGPDDTGIVMWDADRVQLALQAIVLRENGYICNEVIVFYQKTRQRVRVPVDDVLIAEAHAAVAAAWLLAEQAVIPLPLVDSPKCPGCSLNPICLPDETNLLAAASGLQLNLFEPNLELSESFRKPPASEGIAATPVRRLVTARDDLRPLYLNSQGFRMGKSGEVLQVKDKDKIVQEVRIGEVCQVNVMGNIQITTQAVQSLCEQGVPISYFTIGGYFYGVTTGMNSKNIALRRSQFRLADSPWFALSIARAVVAGKIRNQRTLLQRNHIEPPRNTLDSMKHTPQKRNPPRTWANSLALKALPPGFTSRSSRA